MILAICTPWLTGIGVAVVLTMLIGVAGPFTAGGFQAISIGAPGPELSADGRNPGGASIIVVSPLLTAELLPGGIQMNTLGARVETDSSGVDVDRVFTTTGRSIGRTGGPTTMFFQWKPGK